MIPSSSTIELIMKSRVAWSKKPLRKLTKKQRLEIYNYALIRIENYQSEFMCNALAEGIKRYHKRYVGDVDIQVLFPEFHENRPQDADYVLGWWYRWEIGKTQCRLNRIEYLNKMIKLVE